MCRVHATTREKLIGDIGTRDASCSGAPPLYSGDASCNGAPLVFCLPETHEIEVRLA